MTSVDLDQPTHPTTPRRDIQGLRAVSVLAVITNHLFAFPRGGFVGVDVFFVLSVGSRSLPSTVDGFAGSCRCRRSSW